MCIQTRGADPSLQHEVTEVLDSIKAAGLTVVRTWAFNDGDSWNALQTAPGDPVTGILTEWIVPRTLENRPNPLSPVLIPFCQLIKIWMS